MTYGDAADVIACVPAQAGYALFYLLEDEDGELTLDDTATPVVAWVVRACGAVVPVAMTTVANPNRAFLRTPEGAYEFAGDFFPDRTAVLYEVERMNVRRATED